MRKIINNKINSDIEPFRRLRTELEQGAKNVDVAGLSGTARSLLTALLFKRLGKLLLVVCPEEKDAQAFASDLTLFLGEEKVLYYPPLDFLAIDMFALQKEEALARLEIMTGLQLSAEAIVVTSAAALMQKVMPFPEFNKYLRIIAVGDLLNREQFGEQLLAGGYKRVSLVEEKGEFSARGNIFDVFPPAQKNPLRLEMIGDEIESIRKFDPVSQRSLDPADAFFVPPANEIVLTPRTLELAVRNIKRRAGSLSLPREIRNRLVETLQNNPAGSINPIFLPLFYEVYEENSGFLQKNLSCFLDYLPSGALVVLDDPLAVQQAARSMESNIDKLLFKAKNSEKFHLDKESVYIDSGATFAVLEKFPRINLTGLKLDELKDAVAKIVPFETFKDVYRDIPQDGEIKEEVLLRQTVEKIKMWLAEDKRVFFFCPSAEDLQRMRHMLLSYDLPVSLLSPADSVLEIAENFNGKAALLLIPGKISAGFIFPAMNLVFLSEEEIFVKKIPRRRMRPVREGYFLKTFGDLNEGDFVVHTDFGIGIYKGLKKITVGRIENDFLAIEYSDGDKLYLPVNSLEKIQRYLGPDGYVPKVDKMGGSSWDAVKERVKKSVREVAEEMVAIYAAREVMKRDAFSPPDRIYEEFCSTFEFEETPDQARAIEDIHLDMDEAKPMDRLVCGDAGFGKTEVALRAALRAVLDGKQVAVLTPTTILAEQHYQTFSRRLRDFPVHVEVLNRFKSAAEQKKIIADLKNQQVDIVVGTHRLLQKDVEFKDLGLVVIDEEQRFGVAHKEKLKKMRTLVDVLTLSATPIPRTLHLSLVGIRDLSIINTPPADRQPIKTYVLEFDEETIKAAVEKELARQGQIFFVHDRVRSIYSLAHLLGRLVPQAKIEVVHGQMKPAEIEKTMARFIRRECDVLVCTTIIGSGLDIPSANTIIINRADRFGLAQLYQIRGRVGRADQEAYAYLLLPRGAMLSREAIKRLQVIKEFSEPGSGFRIAYNDMEIRGGGNLLGVSQSGHVSAVGYELYTELMEKTIREIKGEKVIEEEPLPEIQLAVSAFIPEEYVQDVHQRLVLYKRISIAENPGDIDRIKEELLDCYGALPQKVENLLQIINIRNRLKPIKGYKMGYDGKCLYIFFRETSPVDPAKILLLYRKKTKELRFTPDHKLFVSLPGLAEGEILAQSSLLLKVLAE
ncbi:MAG: Transcription-repair-coupling factor [Smithella sp. PtaU1.Bin162]|nr:MAG: Transcription-repair-coupling factor [Smithella sp. PtaU1.Bin162]